MTFPSEAKSSLTVKIKKRGRPPRTKTESFTKKETAEDQRKQEGYKRKRASIYDLHENVMERAMEVQANLSPEFPSMIKYMLQSHVTRGFWLGLPSRFCNQYLPKEDTMMTLEDEKGEEFEAKYLAVKFGLSGGWRGFSVFHKISEGDAAVFQLVRRTKFKVYIVRSKGSEELDGALGLLKLEACGQMDFAEDKKYLDKETRIDEVAEKKYSVEEAIPLDIPEDETQKNNPTNLEQILYHSENDSEDHGSEILDGIMLATTVADFKEVRNIENFKIFANGLIMNSQLSKHLQAKYYELCNSRKAYLHDHLLGGLNSQLVAGIISETINIADAIRAAKLATPHDNLVTWFKTLKSFEGLGMGVGFLLARLEKLINLSSKWVRYEEARVEQAKAEEEKRMLELKLLEVNVMLTRIDSEMKTLGVLNGQILEQVFKEVASGPW